MKLDNYSFDIIIETLDLLEDNGPYMMHIADFSLDDEYTNMLRFIKRYKPELLARYPSSYDELIESDDRDRLIDFLAFLGIDVGFGTVQATFSGVFYSIIDLISKPDSGD